MLGETDVGECFGQTVQLLLGSPFYVQRHESPGTAECPDTACLKH